MNILLLSPEDLQSSDSALLRDPTRCHHILHVHGAQIGDSLKVGILNGLLGEATITGMDDQSIRLEGLTLTRSPPPALAVQVLLALPRPKMLKRILQTLAGLGVKHIFLLNSYRVEKSYWQTPWLTPEAIHQQLLLGLEQACDTRLPSIQLIKRFKPFAEDQLPTLSANTRRLVAHPYAQQDCPAGVSEAVTLAIGPEGGWIPYEIDALQGAGFQAVHLGERIMRVETAIPFVLGRLFN